MPFCEELWNSELFATVRELTGLCRGEGGGQSEFSAQGPVWRSSQGGAEIVGHFLLHGSRSDERNHSCFWD